MLMITEEHSQLAAFELTPLTLVKFAPLPVNFPTRPQTPHQGMMIFAKEM
jgi:hypothetical protein